MNEEEILKIMEELKENVRYKTIIPNEERNEWKREYDALHGIIDLYHRQQKEIERLKEFEKYYENEKVVWQRKDYISKEKIREKLEKIEELYDEKAKVENFEYNNNQFIVDFIALVEELFEV